MGRPKGSMDLTGRVFDKLIVIERSESRDAKNRPYWLCQCQCGNRVSVRSDTLTTGDKKNCGCVQKELLRQRNKIHNSTHGLSGTRLFRIWSNMIARCHKPNSANYRTTGDVGNWTEEPKMTIEK